MQPLKFWNTVMILPLNLLFTPERIFHSFTPSLPVLDHLCGAWDPLQSVCVPASCGTRTGHSCAWQAQGGVQWSHLCLCSGEADGLGAQSRWTQSPEQMMSGGIVSQGSVTGEGWNQVTACNRRKVPPRPPPQNVTSSTCTFYNRREVLEWEGQTTDEVAEGPSGAEGPPKARPLKLCMTTSSVSSRRSVVLIGDSLPSKGAEGPMCRPAQLRGGLLSPRGSGKEHHWKIPV